MTITKKYIIYEPNKILGSPSLALEEVKFDGWRPNSFDTEDEAIAALVEEEKTWQDYLIILKVFIRK